MISALGLGISGDNLENLLYIPLAFACWTAPIIGILYAYLDWFSPKATDEERERWDDENADIAKFNENGKPVEEEVANMNT